MKAALNRTYGPTDEVVRIEEIDRPEIGNNEVLVKVYATSVSTGAWRMVQMKADGILELPARMVFGVFRPRNPVQGGAFSGRVVSVGEAVTRFRIGDEVMGMVGGGAHAEYIAIAEDKALVKKPAALGYDEAAALPFGGLSALIFLRDFAKLEPGQKVLVTGASGGVGVFGVQIAKQMGAEVTAVTSTGNLELVRSLGADRVIDYKREDFTAGDERYDVVFDTAGVTSFARARRVLAPRGRYVPLEFSGMDILRSLRADAEGRRIVVGVNGDSAEDLGILAAMTERGEVRPVVDGTWPLERIADAYARVGTRHKLGAVVVTVDMPAAAAKTIAAE